MKAELFFVSIVLGWNKRSALRLEAGIDDGTSSSSRARFLRLAGVKPLFAADMLGRNGELRCRISRNSSFSQRQTASRMFIGPYLVFIVIESFVPIASSKSKVIFEEFGSRKTTRRGRVRGTRRRVNWIYTTNLV